MVQQHLSYKEMTDFGCFYTPQKFVDKLIEMVKTNVDGYEEYTYLDSSCGYGAFLKSLYPLRTIGCDIDEKAIEVNIPMNSCTEDTCEYCGGVYLHGLHVSCPHCGAPIKVMK